MDVHGNGENMTNEYTILDSKGSDNDRLNQDWQELIQRFQVLEQTFPVNPDIKNYLRALKKNQPTKSLWRKYWKCMLDMEEQAKQIKFSNGK